MDRKKFYIQPVKCFYNFKHSKHVFVARERPRLSVRIVVIRNNTELKDNLGSVSNSWIRLKWCTSETSIVHMS